MVVQYLSATEELMAMQEDEKQREEETEKLREEVKRLKLQQLDESKCSEWGPDEITAWIINLDTNRMRKYPKALTTGLVENDANGDLLAELDGADLKEWGIMDRKDRKYVMREIEKLVGNHTSIAKQNSKDPMMEGTNAAPTTYM